MTGFEKFAHFEKASDPQVSSQYIENELNGPYDKKQNGLVLCSVWFSGLVF